MIAVDTNLLVYAHRPESPFHVAAAACLESLANGSGAWAIPWPCVHEFYSVVSNPRIFNTPTPFDVAVQAIDAWLASPTLHLLHESASHWQLLGELIRASRVVGPRIHDARIAVICLDNGVRELWSADHDFGRFPRLAVRNPLVDAR